MKFLFPIINNKKRDGIQKKRQFLCVFLLCLFDTHFRFCWISILPFHFRCFGHYGLTELLALVDESRVDARWSRKTHKVVVMFCRYTALNLEHWLFAVRGGAANRQESHARRACKCLIRNLIEQRARFGIVGASNYRTETKHQTRRSAGGVGGREAERIGNCIMLLLRTAAECRVQLRYGRMHILNHSFLIHSWHSQYIKIVHKMRKGKRNTHQSTALQFILRPSVSIPGRQKTPALHSEFTTTVRSSKHNLTKVLTKLHLLSLLLHKIFI